MICCKSVAVYVYRYNWQQTDTDKGNETKPVQTCKEDPQKLKAESASSGEQKEHQKGKDRGKVPVLACKKNAKKDKGRDSVNLGKQNGCIGR